MPIQYYSRFSHTLHLLPEVFKIHFRSRELPTLSPSKPLILTPPTKTSNNCLPLGFFRQFFAYAFLTSLETWKTKNCKSEQDADKFLYSEMDGQQCHSKHHVEIVPKNHVTCFYVLLWSLSKKCANRSLVLQEMCWRTGKEKISTQLWFQPLRR